MAETLPYKLYSYNVNGQNYTEAGAYPNLPQGYSETNFGGALNTALGRAKGQYDIFTSSGGKDAIGSQQNYELLKGISDRYSSGGLTDSDYETLRTRIGASNLTAAQLKQLAGGSQVGSQYSIGPKTADNPSGFYDTAALNQMNQLANDPNQINVGTAEAPKYVPKGSPGAMLQSALGKQSDLTPQAQFDESMKGTPIPGTEPISPSSKFEKGFKDALGAGEKVSDTGDGGAKIVNQYASGKKNDLTSTFIQGDEYIGGLMTSLQEFMDPKNQRTSLADTYKQMLKDSGVEAIDMELINTKKVIEGSEDDIRTEITKAGGFATDSQVLALTNARNKQLIKNYNTLLETRNAKEKYLQTAIGLEAQDRQAADQRFESMFNMGMQIANYQQQMTNNARTQAQWLASNIGFDGLYDATGGDKFAQGLIEQTLGLPQGGLLNAATQARTLRQQELDKDKTFGTIDLGNRVAITDNKGNIIRYETKGVSPGTGGGILSTLPISVQTKLIGMAESFGSTDIVKKYNATVDGINLVNNINATSQNPSDHQTIVYAFAKSLDPESVVREGEYETIKKYSQSTLSKYGKEITNALNGTGFLSQEAIQNIKTTMNNNYNSRKPAYDNLRSEKSRVIDSIAGQSVSGELLIDYSGGVSQGIDTTNVDTLVNNYVSGLTPTNITPGNWFGNIWSWLTK